VRPATSTNALEGIIADTVTVIVRINEIVSRVVWWVNVDHFHSTLVALLQQLEHLQVLTLNEDILRRVPFNRFLRDWNERRCAGDLDGSHRLGFTGPGESVALLANLDAVAEREPELFKIDLALGEDFGKQAP